MVKAGGPDTFTEEERRELSELHRLMERDPLNEAIEERSMMVHLSRNTRTPVSYWMEVDWLELRLLWIPAIELAAEETEKAMDEAHKKAMKGSLNKGR